MNTTRTPQTISRRELVGLLPPRRDNDDGASVRVVAELRGSVDRSAVLFELASELGTVLAHDETSATLSDGSRLFRFYL